MTLNGVEDISEFGESFIKSHNEKSDEGYLFEADVQCLENLHNFHNDLPLLPERMKFGKIEKLVANLHDKTEHVIHKESVKNALNHGLVLKNNDFIK